MYCNVLFLQNRGELYSSLLYTLVYSCILLYILVYSCIFLYTLVYSCIPSDGSKVCSSGKDNHIKLINVVEGSIIVSSKAQECYQ